MTDDLREQLAAYAHEAWAGWMRYLFKAGTTNPDGSFTIQPWAVERWTRQMNTDYAALPDAEKESDRHEADEILEIIAARQSSTPQTNYASGVAQSKAVLTCLVDGCEARAFGLNLYCPKHRRRYQRHGDPATVLKRGRKAKA